MEFKIALIDNNYCANLNWIVRFFAWDDSGYAFAYIDNQRHISSINSQLKQILFEKQLNLHIFNFDDISGLPLVEQLQRQLNRILKH